MASNFFKFFLVAFFASMVTLALLAHLGAGEEVDAGHSGTTVMTSIFTPIPEIQHGLSLRVFADDIELDTATTSQWREYCEYKQKLTVWEAGAQAIADRLYPDKIVRTADNPIPLPSYYQNGLDEFEFHADVLTQLPARPAVVAQPPVTEVQLRLVLTNHTGDPITINDDVYSDMAHITLEIAGPAAHAVKRRMYLATADIRGGREIVIGPGASHTIDLTRLSHGNRGCQGWSLCEPGLYELNVKLSDHSWQRDRARSFQAVPVMLKVRSNDQADQMARTSPLETP